MLAREMAGRINNPNPNAAAFWPWPSNVREKIVERNQLIDRKKAKRKGGDPKNPQLSDPNSDPTTDPKPGPGPGDSKGGDKKTPSRGSITHLPDSTQRVPLSAADANAFLEQAIDRIERARPAARPHDVPLRGKDW